MTQPDSLLVVVPTYGHFDYAEAAVASAFQATKCEVVVCIVDDASPDWSEDWARNLQLQSPRDKLIWARHDVNQGLTRMWNFGVATAIGGNFKYVCLTNSDVLFTSGWDVRLREAVNTGWHLVGPLTNTPGDNEAQYVRPHSVDYENSDSQLVLDAVAKELGRKTKVVQGPLNGFCLFGAVHTFQRHLYDPSRMMAFKPSNPVNSKGKPNPTPLMTLSEHELQQRWREEGCKTGVVLGSYVYHYRSVSRGERERVIDGTDMRGASPAELASLEFSVDDN